MKNKYRVGLSSCSKLLDEALFADFRAAGIDAIEISCGRDECARLDYAELARLSEKYGVELWSFHLPFAPLSEIEMSCEATADATVAYYAGLIRMGSEIGIKRFVVHPSGEPIAECDRAARMARSRKSLARLAEVAEKYGATVAVEDLPRTCLGRSSDEVMELISAHPALRVCFDTNHLLAEDPVKFIRALGDKIVTLHVSDYDFIDERHWLPGEGDTDWQALMDALDEVGYSGVWMYEITYGASRTISRERDLCPADFAKNAAELFAGEPLTVLKSVKTV